MIKLRSLTVRKRIESGQGLEVGNLALLNAVIYEKRSNGEWRRAKDQEIGRRQFDESSDKRRRSAWPSRKQLQSALLLVLESLGGKIILKEQQAEMMDTLAEHFGLNEEQRSLKHPTAGTRWANVIHWAKLKLVQEGKLDRDAPFGIWALAPKVESDN
jgi:hypothetical protein